MDDLNSYRAKLDDINDKLTLLYQERLNIVKKIGEYKKNNNIPILDSNRENKIIEAAEKKVQDEYKDYIKRFFEFVMRESKIYQNK